MSNNKANHTGTRREDWGTPIDLFMTLASEHDFVIDLCATGENKLCSYYIGPSIDLFSPDAEKYIEKALEISTVAGSLPVRPYAWINPPYQGGGKTGLFVARAVELCKAYDLGLVALIPASVGSVWWRESVVPFFDFVIFTRRLQFHGAPGFAQFDTAIAVMGAPGENWVGTTAAHDSLGVAYKRIGV